MKPTAYEGITRNMVVNLKETVNTCFDGLYKRLDNIESTQKELFNHQSNRLPLWTTILMTGGGSLISILLTVILLR